ncbi:unnamed protein product [Durusdinium trenchii]
MCLQCLMIPGVTKQILKDALRLQVEYARRHSYDLYTYVDDTDMLKTGRSPLWYKIRSTQYLIDSGTTGCDYIFWMDSAAVIMNMSFSLESLIHWNGMQDTDVVVSGDTLAVNLAQSLWKFSGFSRDLLEDMWNIGDVKLNETGSINVILGGCQPKDSQDQKVTCYNTMGKGQQNRDFARDVVYPGDNHRIAELVVNKSMLAHMKWVPKRTINAYPYGLLGGRFKLGDGDFLVNCPSVKGQQMLSSFVSSALQSAGLEEALELLPGGTDAVDEGPDVEQKPKDQGKDELASPRVRGKKDPRTIPNATLSTLPWVVHRFAKPQAAPHMCLQCLMIPGVTKQILKDALRLQVEYARRHGYDLYTYVDDIDMLKTGRSPLWYKIRSTQYLIDSGTTGCDYIFWMDSDAVIMNMSFSLESLIHWNGMQDTDVVVSGDTLAVNLAQSLWKFSGFSRDLLEDMWNIGNGAKVHLEETGSINVILGGCQPNDPQKRKNACYDKMDRWFNLKFAQQVYFPANNTMIAEVVVNKSLLPHMKWVPKRTMNSYPYGVYFGQYQLGDSDFIVHCPSRKGKMVLREYMDMGLQAAGLQIDLGALGRKDPSSIPNATLSSTPWVIHRFAAPSSKPHICLQCLMEKGFAEKDLFDVMRLQVEYARRHGYDLYTIVNEKTHRTLNPARSSQLLMSGGTGCDYIFWVEKNAVILDMNFRLEGLINWKGLPDTDLVVVGTEKEAVNFGAVLWKVSDFNLQLFKDLEDFGPVVDSNGDALSGAMNAMLGGCGKQNSYAEKQTCRKLQISEDLILRGDTVEIAKELSNKSLLTHVKWTPKRLLLAHPATVGFPKGEHEWDDPDFLVHCPGIWGSKAIRRFLDAKLVQFGLDPPPEDPGAAGRRDPTVIPNATLTSIPWVVHRFAKPGASPHMCMQCLMIPSVSKKSLQDVLRLQVEYARRHGYDLYTFIDERDRASTGRSPLWYKIKSTIYLIDSGTTGCDYIFWMDSDTVINNMSFSLESLIHWNGMQDTDVVVAGDTLAVNLAQSLWKFSRFSRDLLQDMWHIGSVPLEETGSINVILGGCQPLDNKTQKRSCYNHMDEGWRNKTFAQEVVFPGNDPRIRELVVNKSLLPHIKWVPKRTINAYPKGLYGGQHGKGDGDFIVHCPSRAGKMILSGFITTALQNAGLKP